jgi:hypothetical protein
MQAGAYAAMYDSVLPTKPIGEAVVPTLGPCATPLLPGHHLDNPSWQQTRKLEQKPNASRRHRAKVLGRANEWHKGQ